MTEATEGWEAEARRELANGDKAKAIEMVRDNLGVGRREATELVEAWERGVA